VIPYEFAIALAENAVDNGVEPVSDAQVEITVTESSGTTRSLCYQMRMFTLKHREPKEYVTNVTKSAKATMFRFWPRHSVP
jgi:hypothetical protein